MLDIVLIKDIIKYGFGVEPTMDSVRIIPTAYFPTNKAEITLPVCGNPFTVRYENRNQGERRFYVNGQRVEASFDKMRNTHYIKLDKADLANVRTVTIVD